MDLELFNYSAIARRLNLSVMYVHHLLSGARKSEKRLMQIAQVLRVSLDELKKAIAQGRAKTGGARAHAAKHSLMSNRHPSHNGGASARPKVYKYKR